MELNKKLEELKPYQLNCNVFDVYSYNGLTMQDLLCQFFTKINECITVSNETIDLAKWLVNEGLEIEVVKKLMLWLEDGTLENIINVNIFNTLNEKINGLSSQLEHITINLSEYIKADGVTDDSIAINEVLENAKNGATILFPKGKRIKINDTIKIKKAVLIDGNNSSLICNLCGNAIEFGEINSNLPSAHATSYSIGLKNISIINDGPTTSNGILLTNIIDGIFENIIILSFNTNLKLLGMNNLGCQSNTFNNVRSIHGYICLNMVCENNGWITENTFNKCYLSTNESSKKSIEIKETDYHRFDSNNFNNCNFENHISDICFDIDNATNFVFHSCRFESRKTQIYKFGANTESNVILFGFGNYGASDGKFDDLGKNIYIGSNASKLYGMGSYVITGENLTPSEDMKKIGFPVFATHNTTNKKRSNTVGHNGIASFNKDDDLNPFFYVDNLSSKVYISNTYYPLNEQCYFISPSKRAIQVMNDTEDVEFRIGDQTKSSFLMLGNRWIWVDSSGRLRISSGIVKPTDIDRDGYVVGAQT